jgi:CubicO group peptidase (beta-lactamase class C family)
MRWLALCLALVACKQNPSKLDDLGATKKSTPAAVPAPLAWDATAVDAWLKKRVEDSGAVGVAVVVVRDGKTVLAKGYGKKRGDANELVTPDTPFAIGSLSKQFACAAIYTLVDRGQLAMTDPVAKWYPDLNRAADITLADLGAHISGYRDFYPLDYVDERMTKPIAADDLIAQYAKAIPLDFEPRTRWSYSNTGFVILARVVEKVSGMPYGKALEQWIFQPLGMTATTARPASAATGHVSFLLDGAKPAPFEADQWMLGAGDIWASANDLAKWDVAFAEGKLLSPQSRQAIETPRVLQSGRGASYSCGQFLRIQRGETILSHNGWVGGFFTYNAIVPRTRSAVIVLTNDEYNQVVDVGERMLAWITMDEAIPVPAGAPSADVARDLIVSLQRGKVDRSLLGDDASAYFDDARVAAASAKLRDLGTPTVTVTSRSERGALEHTSLSIAFPSKTVSASMFRSTDGKIRQLLFEN